MSSVIISLLKVTISCNRNDPKTAICLNLRISLSCLDPTSHLGLFSYIFNLSFCKAPTFFRLHERIYCVRDNSGLHLMSFLWPFIHLLNGSTVSSTYWCPQIPHSKRSMGLLDLQLTFQKIVPPVPSSPSDPDVELCCFHGFASHAASIRTPLALPNPWFACRYLSSHH